jgi:quinol monooxygenase YgiN
MVFTLTVHLHVNDQPESIGKLKAKLIEASRIYTKDPGTLHWFVMQDKVDPRAFTIVERYEEEGVSTAFVHELASSPSSCMR